MAGPGEQLTSWKEIAAYLKRTVRTCQRLESGMGLPVHRLNGSSKAHVFAYRTELDAWLSRMIHEREIKRKKRRFLLTFSAVLAAVGITAVLLVAVLSGKKAAPDGRPLRDTESVAVLVHDLSPEPGREHIPDGIGEAIRNALCKVRGLRVTGKISSDAVKERMLDEREIGRLLGVNNILNLSFQAANGQLRITVQLVSARDGFLTWAETYEEPIQDIFGIEDQIATDIAGRLKASFLSGGRGASSPPPTPDAQAYNHYLRGRFLLGRPRPEAPGEALRCFRDALERDPQFARAYTGIAWVYMNMISLYLARPTELGPMAEAAVKRALSLDPDLAEAHALNAWLQFVYNFDWDAAGKSFRTALDFSPGDAMTRGMYAFYLFTRKQFREARTEIRSALASDPFMPVLSAYSMWIHLFTGASTEVLEEFKRVQLFEPDYEFTHFAAGMSYLRLGRIDESIEMLKNACRLPHNNGRPEAGLAVAYLKKGDREAAEAIYAELLKGSEKSGVVPAVNLAWISASLGDFDAAYEWLETAIREHDPMIPSLHIYAEESLPDFARQPRFQAILDRLRLPH